MSVVESLERLGGVAARGVLIQASSRSAVDRALEAGAVIALARGRYALPAADEARRAAHALSGAVSWRSAALLHGWEVKTPPVPPEVTIPDNRKLTTAQRTGVTIHRAHLHSSEVNQAITTTSRTLVDCMRGLP